MKPLLRSTVGSRLLLLLWAPSSYCQVGQADLGNGMVKNPIIHGDYDWFRID
jgi:hypothetical protein